MKPTLVILAAGMGSRYGGLKQIDAIGPHGETIIDYSVYDAIRAGFGKAVFVIRESIAAAFRAHIGDKFAGNIAVEYAMQELDRVPAGLHWNPQRQKPWGTGHAVLVCEEQVQQPFAVINADDFYGASSFQLLSDFLSGLSPQAHTHCMVGYRLDNTLSDFGYVSRGVCETDAQGYLLGVTERTHIQRQGEQIVYMEEGEAVPLSGEETVSMNMLGFAPSVFKWFRKYFEEFIAQNHQQLKAEFYIPTVVNRLIQEGRGSVKVLQSPEKWFGVTYQEDKATARQNIRRLIDAGVYPEKLWA
ncbi:MAG: nucleotidyltransferase [Bacteroidetes bacterium]|nr:MAG: nucleotidyltransferase [Bacteroidota bacterium]